MSVEQSDTGRGVLGGEPASVEAATGADPAGVLHTYYWCGASIAFLALPPVTGLLGLAEPTGERLRMKSKAFEKTRTDDEQQRQDTGSKSQSTALAVGSRVVDGDALPDDRNPAIVVGLPAGQLWEVHIDALEGSPTVADLNPEYPRDGFIATIAFESALDAALRCWRSADPERLWRVCENEGVRTYDYPEDRLVRTGGDA